MAAKRNQDASCNRKRPNKTIVDKGDGDSGSWSSLIHDILVSVISRLGVIDFVSFGCVCKSWRTVALSNRNMFMLCREPMYLRMISTERIECYLEDLEGRKFKTFLPNISSNTICLGVVSGYLILLGKETRDFRLLNLITRHELYFPSIPSHIVPDPENFRCTLVFSATLSTWVFVFSKRFLNKVSLCFSSEGAKWTHLVSEFYFIDLHFFQGKIYTLNLDMDISYHLCEVRFGPTPTLKLLKMKNLKDEKLIRLEFATWGGKLHVVGLDKGSYVAFETQFELMRWVKLTQALKADATCFVKIFKFGYSTKREFWMDPCEQYERFGFFHDTAKNKSKGIRYTTDMWYFPHKCLDVNLLQEGPVIE